MKRIVLSLCSVGLIMAGALNANAQKSKSKDNNDEEIIITKKGDKDTKVTIEINGNEVMVNGKPLSEYKGDGVIINKLRDRLHDGNTFMYTPRAGGNHFEWNDSSNEKKAMLGVTTEKGDHGVRISDVDEGSAAEKAGLKEDDIITEVGNKKINDPDDIVAAIAGYKPKDEVTIKYERNGKPADTKATLGSRSGNFFKTFSFNNEGMGGDFNMLKPAMPRMQDGTFNLLRDLGNPRLGVRIEDLDEGDGVKITNVESGSAAEKAGLKKDDIISEIDGKKVKTVNDARSQIRGIKDKTSYTVKAKRNGTESTYEVKITKRKNNADL